MLLQGIAIVYETASLKTLKQTIPTKTCTLGGKLIQERGVRFEITL